MIQKIAAFIANHPKIILIAATVLLIPAAFGYIGTFVNYDIMSYLPADIESVQGEKILDESFGCAANAFLVVENMEAGDVAAVKERIAGVDGVSSVTWVDDIIDVQVPAAMLPDAITDIFYSTDKSATLLMVQFCEGAASTATMDAIKQIKSMLNEQCFLSGMSAIMQETKVLADTEAPIYIAIAIVCALIALSFTMDSYVLPFVLLISLGYAVVYNMGTNFWMPNGISYITQCIAAILQLGVTMDYSVFLMDRYDEELTRNPDRKGAMTKAITATFHSLLGSSLTTVFGFLALCFMSFTLGLDIGLVMAKGVLFGVATVVVVLPTFLLLFHKPIHKLRHRRFIPNFSGMNRFLLKHRKGLAVVFALLLVPSVLLKNAVELNYCVADAMPEQLASVQSLKKLKNDFNMATTHFVIIHDSVPAPQVSRMVDEIEKTPGISTVISLNSYVGPAISEAMLPDEIKTICMQDGYQLMMVNTVFSPSTDEENAQIDELTKIIKRYDPEGYLTGEGVMSKDLITVTDKDFKVTSIISIAAIFLLIAVSFKSAVIPVLLVLSIELAIMINEGIPFFTGADVIFIAPTVISCVQLGATVDYAILLTTRYREELRRGLDKIHAMQVAADASDRSVFQSALVFFSATFGVYVVCNIEIVGSLCAMLARGAVISGLVIMIFLPALLTVCEDLIEKCSYRWKEKPASAFEKEEIRHE